MKKYFVVIAVLFSFTAAAQDLERTNSDIWLEQIYSVRQIAPSGNVAYLEQEGNSNVLITEQNQTGDLLNPNMLEIVQKGDNNYNFTYQEGYGLNSRSLQSGDGNVIVSNLLGNQTETRIAQFGSNHRLEQFIDGNNSNFQIIQEGIDNTLIHRETEAVPKNMIIEQRGTGMRMTIENFNIR